MSELGKKLTLAWVAVGLSMGNGCQTQEPNSGLTLPSPHYLRHPPQYFPPSPPFPLPNELQSLEKAQKQARELEGANFPGQ